MRGSIEKTRVIAHVDLDYFFAQCEERENSAYKGKPVVVCVYSARGGDSGAVSTANYIARDFNIKSGMPIIFAKRLLKDVEAVFLPVNHGLYNKISSEIMAILRGYTDRFEQESIDEASLDITEKVGHDFNRAREIALRIKNEILEKEKLTCSVGVAPNKLVAKIAAGFQKPDGLTVVPIEEVKSFLSLLPIGLLYGVGHKTERIMLELGIKNIGDLAQHRAEDLVRVFGRKLGTYFHKAANGIDESPVQERRGAIQISKITTLKKDTRNIDEIVEDLERLCDDIQRRILASNLMFHSLGIIVVAENMKTYSKSRTLDSYTNTFETLKGISYQLLTQFIEKSQLKIRRIGIRVSDLTSTSMQRTLRDFL